MNIIDSIRSELPALNYYLKTFGDSRAMEAEDYLYTWSQEKENLFHIFGDKPILEKSIDLEKDKDTLHRSFLDMQFENPCFSVVERSLREILDFVLFKGKENKYRAIDVLYTGYAYKTADSIKNDCTRKKLDLIEGISYLLRDESNRMQKNQVGFNIVIPADETSFLEKKFVVMPNEKPFKLFNNIIKRFKGICQVKNPAMFDSFFWDKLQENLEQSRLLHSQWLNDKFIHGTLCVSIHPLDFLTMSDNSYGWTSCMRWTYQDDAADAGDYRCGALEMMNSSCVVVAYLKGKDPYQIPGSDFYWSNKKWRQLFIVDRDFIVGIKGYPYKSPILESHVLNWLADLCEKQYPAYYREIMYSETDNIYINEYIITLTTRIMYNDCTYNGVSYLMSSEATKREYDMMNYNYSGVAACLICGNQVEDDTTPLCESCNTSVRCYSCGAPIDILSEFFIKDEYGDCYCANCCGTCSICGEDYPESQLSWYSVNGIGHGECCPACASELHYFNRRQMRNPSTPTAL